MIHALIAVAICLVFGLIRLPVWFCLGPAVFYIGREFTQAEYRYIEAYCDGVRANMPWYGGFLPAAWTVKGLLDWVLPLAVCVLAALVVWLVRR